MKFGRTQGFCFALLSLRAVSLMHRRLQATGKNSLLTAEFAVSRVLRLPPGPKLYRSSQHAKSCRQQQQRRRLGNR